MPQYSPEWLQKIRCNRNAYEPDKNTYRKNLKMLYSKNEYSPGVKVHDWANAANFREYRAKNPLEPGKFDLLASHFDHFGNEPVKYVTESNAEFTWKVIKPQSDPHKKMTNICSYRDEDAVNEAGNVSKECVNDYCTTMQSSFMPPYPYVMPRIAMAKTPYYLNRRMVQPIQTSPFKFYDEEALWHVCKLQKYKGEREISYIPWLGKYTDGSK